MSGRSREQGRPRFGGSRLNMILEALQARRGWSLNRSTRVILSREGFDQGGSLDKPTLVDLGCLRGLRPTVLQEAPVLKRFALSRALFLDIAVGPIVLQEAPILKRFALSKALFL